MRKGTMRAAAVALLMMAAGGCTVMRSDYDLKVRETEGLSKDLSDLNRRQRELMVENEGLKTRVERHRLELTNTTAERDKALSDLRYVTGARDKAVADNRELEKALQAKSDSLSQSVGELRKKSELLEVENRKLQDEIGARKKLQEALEKSKDEKARLVAELQASQERLRTELASRGKTAEERGKQAGELASANEKLKIDLAVAQKTLEERQKSLEENRKALEEKTRQLAELSASSERMKGELATLQKSGEESAKRAAELKSDNERLARELESQKKTAEAKVEEVSTTYKDLLEKMKGEIDKGQVTISELKGKLTLNVADHVLFDSGKAEVKPAGVAVLQKAVPVLLDLKDKAVRIEGHTDNVQITGSLAKQYPSNWELSAARAINVTRFLQKQGVDQGILAAIAYGETRPVAPNTTPEGKAKNRRIEIILLPKE